MKEFLKWLACVIAVLIMLFGGMYLMRLWSNSTTPIVIQEVEPGVMCATMVTTDGAAIDCWYKLDE